MRSVSVRALAGLMANLWWFSPTGVNAEDELRITADPLPSSTAEPAPSVRFNDPDETVPESAELPAPGRVESFEEEIPRIEDPGTNIQMTDDSLFPLPRREDWQALSRRLSFALAAGSIEQLAALEPELKIALAALDAIPGHVEYAEWLRARMGDVEVAAVVSRRTAMRDSPVVSLAGTEPIPMYDVWLEWMKDRPAPPRAQELVPQLKPIFAAERLPPALVWIAETESSFNPNARSPAGARGLFQLMPATARELGLKVSPTDERLDPVRNAASAARYLAQLRQSFGDWPLALAAYNAGPTRVSRLLEENSGRTFADIAEALPLETRLYVPKVLATVTVREGVTPSALALVDTLVATDA